MTSVIKYYEGIDSVAIIGNYLLRQCGIATFTSDLVEGLSAEDARYLAREFQHIFEETDLVNLPNYNIYLKLLIDGVTSRAFSAVTLNSTRTIESNKNIIVEISRKMYNKRT